MAMVTVVWSILNLFGPKSYRHFRQIWQAFTTRLCYRPFTFHHVHYPSQYCDLSLDHHLYADDTQLFFSLHYSLDFDSSISHLKNALQQISMTANLLTPNSLTPPRLNWPMLCPRISGGGGYFRKSAMPPHLRQYQHFVHQMPINNATKLLPLTNHWPIASLFKWYFSYSCVAVGKISVDVERRSVPLLAMITTRRCTGIGCVQQL